MISRLSRLALLLWTGDRPADLSIRDCYTRILAQPEDGYRRAHTRRYEGDPTTPDQWPLASLRYHATAPLVAHDERHSEKRTPHARDSY